MPVPLALALSWPVTVALACGLAGFLSWLEKIRAYLEGEGEAILYRDGGRLASFLTTLQSGDTTTKEGSRTRTVIRTFEPRPELEL